MKSKLVILVIATFLIQHSLQDVDNNEVEVEDVNPFQEAASAFMDDKEGPNLGNLGGMLSSFISSEGGKQIGDMLMGAATNNNDATAQILQGLGTILTQNSEGSSGDEESSGQGFDPSMLVGVFSSMMNQNNGGGGQGFDPSIIGNVLGMLNTVNQANAQPNAKPSKARAKQQPRQQQDTPEIDFSAVFNILGSLMNAGGNRQGGGGGDPKNLMSYLPMILSTVNSFIGQDAQNREQEHADHAWMLPPILERVHVMFDHFMNSELGRSMVSKIGAEKFVKIFSDEKGNFSYKKFTEKLENQSFRRHWIKMITKRISEVISYFADPYTQKRFLQTIQFFVNSFLKGQGFPKGALFDPDRPTESITSFVNHVSKKFFNTKFNAKMYVKPAVEYVQDVFRLAQTKGLLGRAVDSSQLSDKLTDTINLDIIEPIVRVNRAYKFAKKVPQCDRYVLCLINQDVPDDGSSLPGLKKLLSKGSSIFASWFLSGKTGTSFWSLYNVITDENNCQARFVDACNDFHIDEIRVTSEYVHNEL